jgi:hypothetical protein
MTDQKEDKKLTFKQRKWLRIYLECGNATEAATQVYNCKDRESAANIGWENVRKLDYTDFMEEAGITDRLLQQKILEGLDANRTISAQVIVKSNDPKVKTKSATARDVDFIDVPDFAIRHKYLETALKLKKRLDNKLNLPLEDGSVQSVTVVFKRKSE